MKHVKCKSGLIGWQDKLQNVYSTLAEFKTYCRIYNIHKRLGFKSMKSAWEVNPTLKGSVNPGDLEIVSDKIKFEDEIGGGMRNCGDNED